MRAPKSRLLLATALRDLPPDGQGIEAVVDRLMSSRREIIGAESEDLIRAGLISIAGSVRKRRGRDKQANPAQGHFWDEYHLPETCSIPDRKGQGKPVTINTKKMTIAEAREYIAAHSRRERTESDRIRELERAVKDLEPFAPAPSATLEECWQAKRVGED